MHKPRVACPPPAFTLIELLVERRSGKVEIGKGGKHPALLEPLRNTVLPNRSVFSRKISVMTGDAIVVTDSHGRKMAEVPDEAS